MSSITRECSIAIDPAEAWDALSDWSGIRERLVAGFVTDVRLTEDGDRILTFYNGMVARERLVASDPERKRLVWTVVDGKFAHYNGAAEIKSDDDGGIRFAWTSDFLPDEAAGLMSEVMDRGIRSIEETLGVRRSEAGATR